MSATNAINNALIVTAHPVDNSLSHSLAARIAGKLREQGTQVEIADLHAEGFNPAMTRADLDLYHGDPSALPGLKNVKLDILYQADTATPEQVEDFLQGLESLK